MRKDRNSILLEKKIDFYNTLMENLKEILCKEDGIFTRNQMVAVQILNQKMAYIAGEKVVETFAKFAELFANAVKDKKLSDSERDEILEALSEMSVKMRID